MFNKILVPLDSSNLAEQALEPAITLARKTGGELILLSASNVQQLVIADPIGHGMIEMDVAQTHGQKNLSAYLDKIQHKVPTNIPVETKIIEGDAASAIVDTVVNENVDLIVMSTHGRSGLSRWVMGSVTERVFRHAPCPVLALREDTSLANVLITLDGSPLSEYALEPGLAIARKLQSDVTLMSTQSTNHIAPAIIAELDDAEPGLGTMTQNDFYHRAENYLRHTAKRMQPDIEQTIQIAPMEGKAASSILDYINTHDVNLVVMATHGRTGLKRWRYGSVTEKVLRHANCALLIIRPPLSEFE